MKVWLLQEQYDGDFDDPHIHVYATRGAAVHAAQNIVREWWLDYLDDEEEMEDSDMVPSDWRGGNFWFGSSGEHVLSMRETEVLR